MVGVAVSPSSCGSRHSSLVGCEARVTLHHGVSGDR
jgi:hypothetical protein